MKLYVGKRVKLKSNLKGTCKRVGLLEEMEELASRYATITRVRKCDDRFWIDIDYGNFVWERDAFETDEEGWD